MLLRILILIIPNLRFFSLLFSHKETRIYIYKYAKEEKKGKRKELISEKVNIQNILRSSTIKTV